MAMPFQGRSPWDPGESWCDCDGDAVGTEAGRRPLGRTCGARGDFRQPPGRGTTASIFARRPRARVDFSVNRLRALSRSPGFLAVPIHVRRLPVDRHVGAVFLEMQVLGWGVRARRSRTPFCFSFPVGFWAAHPWRC